MGRKRSLYTRSEVNRIIDALIHPLARGRPWLLLVDGLLHALNEQDPVASLVKFLTYNAKPLARALLKEVERQVERGG